MTFCELVMPSPVSWIIDEDHIALFAILVVPRLVDFTRFYALYGTDIFTPLQIRDTSILKEIMDKLDPLMLTDVDSDVKGDAFEYFLKASTATKNDLGEYFTPRHIVKTMVRLVNPKMGEKIYDMKTPRLIQFNYFSADFAA